MNENTPREWDEARRIARREAGLPPAGAENRPGCVTLVVIGFFAGGTIGMSGTMPFLFALHYFFGVHIPSLTPLSLGILGAGIGMVATPLICWRPGDG